MVFSAVAGHLQSLDFPDSHKKWHSCAPVDLYTAPVIKFVPEVCCLHFRLGLLLVQGCLHPARHHHRQTCKDNTYAMQDKLDLKVNLEQQARRSDWLVLWLDCDREGENIAYEVTRCQHVTACKQAHMYTVDNIKVEQLS